MNFRDMIEKIVHDSVERTIADVLGDLDTKGVKVESANSETAEPIKRRRRGRGRNTVNYVRNSKPGRQRTAKDVADDLPAGNVRMTWLAIANAKAPISARQLETVTGLGKKAVESAVYALRAGGQVKSVRVE